MKKILIAILFCTGSYCVRAQDNLPNIINSAGGYGTINGQLYDFNLGELVLTETFSGASGYLFTQGFLQPYFVNATAITDVSVDNNVITPNGDGKNDVFVVKGLEKHPGSKLSIYDRAGRRIFSTSDYKNDWNGFYDGKPLYEDTYYCIIDLGKATGLIRGFISIVRDER